MAKKSEDQAERQTEVPGSDVDRVPEIEGAAREYRNANQTWAEAGKDRNLAHDELKKAMHEHRRKTYRDKTGTRYDLVSKGERVKITKAGDE
jgi:hypothetical protein